MTPRATNPKDVTAPNPSRRSERGRRAILAAATELVTEVGFANLTIEAIAARAGVGKQTIYRWWPSKGAVVFDAFLAEQEAADGGHDLPDSGDLERDLKAALRAAADNLLDPRVDAQYRALTSEIQHDTSLADELLARLLGPLLEATQVRLRSAQQAGHIDPGVDLAIVVELLYGPLYHRWSLRTAPITPEYTDSLVDVILRAVTPA